VIELIFHFRWFDHRADTRVSVSGFLVDNSRWLQFTNSQGGSRYTITTSCSFFVVILSVYSITMRWILKIDLRSSRWGVHSEKIDLPATVPWYWTNVCSSIPETFGGSRKKGESPNKIRWELPADCPSRLTFGELDQTRHAPTRGREREREREKYIGREHGGLWGRQRRVVEYTPAKMMVGGWMMKQIAWLTYRMCVSIPLIELTWRNAGSCYQSTR